jgi:hypothetical protein
MENPISLSYAQLLYAAIRATSDIRQTSGTLLARQLIRIQTQSTL